MCEWNNRACFYAFCLSQIPCHTCAFLNCTIAILGTKSDFNIRNHFTCKSSKIIYCISQVKCCKICIGETGRRLSNRFGEIFTSKETMLTNLFRVILTVPAIVFRIRMFFEVCRRTLDDSPLVPDLHRVQSTGLYLSV